MSSFTFPSVDRSHTINATFAIKTKTITATAGAHGAISPSGAVIVNYGANQRFDITPDPGYHIVDVKVDGHCKGAINTYTFTNVKANHKIEAYFAINTYTIKATAGWHGTIFPSGAVKVNYGGNKTFTITPSQGYHVADVIVDGKSVGAVTSYPFTNVAENHTISATFATTAITEKEEVHPILECVVKNRNGSYTAYFGYLNENTVAVSIPVGPNNKFTPDPQNQGQTTVFQPGRVRSAFTVVFDGHDLVWYLKGPDGVRRTATASRHSHLCR